MDKIHFRNNIQSDITVLPNDFIDRYLVKAEGEFVKVYILLLRLVSQGLYEGPDQLADLLNLMRRDVDRALKYWENEGLIDKKQPAPEVPDIPNISDISDAPRKVPEKTNTPPSELQIAMNDKNFSDTCYAVEAYIGHPLSHNEVATFHYIEKQLGFSAEMLEYLIEYCVELGKRNVRYMESVAIAWYEQGIDTVQKAKKQSSSYNQNVFSIMKAFGISNRNPATSEMEYIKKWNEMGFDTEIIVEACNRAMMKTHQASFPYASGILEQWKKQGVKNKKQILALDKKFHEARPAVSVSVSADHSAGNKKKSSNAFHNFPQRTYDFDDLEARIQNIRKSQ